MSEVCKTNTRWEVSEDGDLMILDSGMEYWKSIFRDDTCFPMGAQTVAGLLRGAFEMGMSAKEAQIKAVLGVKS